MRPELIYLFVFVAFFLIAFWLQKRYCFLCDASSAHPKPYSFARLQLVWWTFIILTSFISVIIASGEIPTFNSSTLLLLGIGILTTATARIIDISDNSTYAAAHATATASNTTTPPKPSVDLPSHGFWMDLLSDKTGISIHRFQAFAFNLVFGVWFIYKTFKDIPRAHTKATAAVINSIIPVISENNLILLGLSAGTYTALKITENK